MKYEPINKLYENWGLIILMWTFTIVQIMAVKFIRLNKSKRKWIFFLYSTELVAEHRFFSATATRQLVFRAVSLIGLMLIHSIINGSPSAFSLRAMVYPGGTSRLSGLRNGQIAPVFFQRAFCHLRRKRCPGMNGKKSIEKVLKKVKKHNKGERESYNIRSCNFFSD